MINLKGLSAEELKNLIEQATIELNSRPTTKKLIVTLEYNKYKGSGKCWIANVDPQTKKILGFLNAESVQETGMNKGKKTFSVPDGHYLFCQSDSGSSDSKKYYRVQGGEKTEF